jgi:hypothetical protein
MRLALRPLLAAAGLALLAGAAFAQSYTASLDGLQEVPPNASPGSGNGTFTLDAAKVLHYSISFGGLVATQTAAHIHGPAAPGTNAGVIFPLPSGSPIVGTVGPLNSTQEANLNAGLLYVNVHTTAFPGGEIRGQILRDQVGVEPRTWGAVKGLYE